MIKDMIKESIVESGKSGHFDYTFMSNRVDAVKTDFDIIKKELKDYFTGLNFDSYGNLPGKRMPKIVSKLVNYPGDISPAMLQTLLTEMTANEAKLRAFEN